MQAIKKKLSSRRGASLTFALLMFLVCAVVGSVVLTAGTAAAGRMSQIAEMDQRYYSVNSAARLLINKIDGEEVTIVETVQTNSGAVPTSSGTTTYTYGDGTTITSFDSIPKEAAYFYITQVDGNPTRLDRIKTSVDNRLVIQYTAGSNTTLAVTVKEEMKNDGTMILTIEKGNGTNAYAMELTFTMDKKSFQDIQSNKTVTTWKIRWNIRDIQIVGAKRW